MKLLWCVSFSHFLVISSRKKPPDFRRSEARWVDLVGSFAVGLRSHRDFIIHFITVKGGNNQHFQKNFSVVFLFCWWVMSFPALFLNGSRLLKLFSKKVLTKGLTL